MENIVMRKQIIYSPLIPRVFAMTIDFVILSLVLTPVMIFISHYVFLYFFNDFFIMHGINSADKEAISVAYRMPEFSTYITPTKFFLYSIILFSINSFCMSAYFLIFWIKFGATPGKMFMRIKIVDATDFCTPSTRNLIKRFLGYITAIIGIWFIVINGRKMAIHDMIANTVVIKS